MRINDKNQMVKPKLKREKDVEEVVSSSGSEPESLSGFHERLNSILKSEQSKSALAVRAGISQSGFHRIVHGGEPGLKNLVAIANAAGVSLEWLATGQTPLASPNPGPPQASDFISIPRYDVKLSAGAGSFTDRAEVLDEIPFTREFMRRKIGRNSLNGLVILEARGDSMEPTIGDGDLVLIDQNEATIQDGILAFTYDENVFVKRIRVQFDGIEIVSDNKDMYPSRNLNQVDMERFHIIGRVRWIGRVIGH